MSYEVILTSAALNDLESIDSKNRTRILKKIEWFSENFGALVPQPLTADLSGLFKLRVGNYRVIYSFDAAISVISIQRVGHRKDVYDN